MSTDGLTAEEVARSAEVDLEFLSRAVESGALTPSGPDSFTADDATRLKFLRAWDDAGLTVEKVGQLVEEGQLTFLFIAPSVLARPRLATTYEELAAEFGFEVSLLQQMHEAIGFDPPARADPVERTTGCWFSWRPRSEHPVVRRMGLLRLLRVYSASLRRIASLQDARRCR